jgi:hypothetical protein
VALEHNLAVVLVVLVDLDGTELVHQVLLLLVALALFTSFGQHRRKYELCNY